MTFMFTLKDPALQRIIQHTLEHPGECHKAYTTEESPPSLFLVKDHGAYLMACTKTPCKADDGKGNLVCYAEGMRPNDEWIGGDDFAENIPLEWFISAQRRKKNAVALIVGATSIECKSY